jgi:hypothetical protein
MENTTMILIAVAIVAVVALVGWWLFKRQTRQRLQTRQELQTEFGPEYQHAVEEHESLAKAEDELDKRRKRFQKLDIRPLTDAEKQRFALEWHAVQARFVDAPSGAITEAHRLVTEVMNTRGYPVDDLVQREADLSVEVPEVVENYRQALLVAEHNERGEASTEDLRQAMVHYRALFQALLEAGEVHDEPPLRRVRAS